MACLSINWPNTDESPEFPLTHGRESRVGHVEAGPKIGINHLIPLLAAHAHERAVPSDTNVVHEDINRAFVSHDLIDACLTCGIVSDIKLVGFKARFCFELLRRFIITCIIRRDVIPGIA